MSRPDPSDALAGVRSGHLCDACNKGLRNGDLVRSYVTFYERGGWTPRRLWCEDCSDGTIGTPTEGADEAILEAVLWDQTLVAVTERDRSRPTSPRCPSDD